MMTMNKTYGIASMCGGLLVFALSGCATHPKGQMAVRPEVAKVLPDANRQVRLDLSFRIPADYFTKRSRLFLTPCLMVGDSVVQAYEPLVLDAAIYRKKMARLEVLEDYNDPYAEQAVPVDNAEAFRIQYKDTLLLPEDVNAGKIFAIASTDGCGECSGVDTLLIATIDDPLSRLTDTWRVAEPKFVVRPKVRDGEGKAHLQFALNRFDMNPELGNNRQEMEQMMRVLRPVLQDSLSTLDHLSITGVASADGPLKLNTDLARNRATAAKDWLVNRLRLSASAARKITVDSRPEGWMPVVDAMRRAGDPDADAVEAIVDKYAGRGDDVQETYIRRLPCWDKVRDTYLQRDRVVEYRYSYTVKSFTSDAEMLRLYRTRPDAFNEEELLRVSTLVKTEAARKEVYQTVLRFFPRSAVAANNLALIYLAEGNASEAEALWRQASAQSEEARYNLGLLLAKERKLDEAVRLLAPFDDENARIVKSIQE
ncbi:hypothetical protein [Parabacteroides sp. An277]|uniref:hypothetical protein n=1 Tax=Parabacteroides sp. An277 TaxID=1965619 RepID=UPI00111DFD5C|nr:hypothetical protein [Parabacteroides sp. An277]